MIIIVLKLKSMSRAFAHGINQKQTQDFKNTCRLQFTETCSLGSCKTSSSLCNDSGPSWQVQTSDEKLSLTVSRNSHLDAYTSMEHTHPSYACIVLQMSDTHCVKFDPKLCPNLTPVCVFSSLWARANKPEPHICIYIRVSIN